MLYSEVLEEIAKAVSGKTKIIVDGGITRDMVRV